MSRRITGTLGPWRGVSAAPAVGGPERRWKGGKLAAHVCSWLGCCRWAVNVYPPPGSRARPRHSDWHTTAEAARAWADAELRRWEEKTP